MDPFDLVLAGVRVVVLIIGGYMLWTGHYPINLDIASLGIRTRHGVPEVYNPWVRVAGGILMIGALTPVKLMAAIFDEPALGFYLLMVLAGAFIGISVIKAYIKPPRL